MNPGKLRHRLVIKAQSTTSTSELGMPVENFTTQATVWGSIEPLTGRELFTAKQVYPLVTHRITVRGNLSLTPAKRIEHESRVFNILSVVDKDERKIEKTVMAMESV
jgi:SPP1 family predicted phage head-tail adaptor